jgi:ribonuclease Y
MLRTTPRSLKKNASLEAKEKFLQLKAEHEQEVNAKNNVLNQRENGIKQKEQSFNQKLENMNRKETNWITRVKNWKPKRDSLVKKQEEVEC